MGKAEIMMGLVNGYDPHQERRKPAERRAGQADGRHHPSADRAEGTAVCHENLIGGAGMDAHLSKPVDIAVLEKTVRKIMGR